MALLGGDRQASRNELRKLALYAHGEGEVTLDDVMAVVADASELKLDPIVDGAFAGKPDLVETEFAKAMVAGTYPGMIISAAQRQAAWLHKSALAVAEGTPVSTLLDSGFPRLHFSRKADCRNRAAQFQRGAAGRDHRAARHRRAGHAQAGPACRRDRAAHAAVDCGEREAAGVSDAHFRHRGASTKRLTGLIAEYLRRATRLLRRSRSPAMTRTRSAASLRQPPHHLVELFEVAVADLDGAAGIAVIDGDGEAERIADALLQRDRVGILALPPPRAFCGLRSGTPSTCASASVWRTLSPSSTMRFAAASGSGTPISARAWPADNWPLAI